MINQLLRIKTFRERKAETEMLKSKMLLAKAQADETEAERELNDYIILANQEERRLREITQVQEEVICLKLGEQVRQESLVSAQKMHQQALQVFDTAWDGYRKASSARQKFDELLRIETLREGIESERKEESELEELAGQIRDRADQEEVDHA